MRSYLHLLFVLAFLPLSFAQKNAGSSYDFNTPPDGFIMNKAYLGTNYYSKLQKLNDTLSITGQKATFLRPFTPEDWIYLQQHQPESYNYYTAAKNWYENLPQRMLTLFTTEELWYIYFYDQQLKYKLETLGQ